MEISKAQADATRKFWTAERKRSAKPVLPKVSKDTGATQIAPNTAATGPAVSVAGSKPGDASVKVTTGEATTQTEPQIYGRHYSYPAPFTRFQSPSYNSYPNRTVGKLFFSNSAGSTFVCSASVVNSENKDLVWTAGHCVSDGRGTFYRNWQFVPAYRSGSASFGVWTPRRVSTTSEWHFAGKPPPGRRGHAHER